MSRCWQNTQLNRCDSWSIWHNLSFKHRKCNLTFARSLKYVIRAWYSAISKINRLITISARQTVCNVLRWWILASIIPCNHIGENQLSNGRDSRKTRDLSNCLHPSITNIPFCCPYCQTYRHRSQRKISAGTDRWQVRSEFEQNSLKI